MPGVAGLLRLRERVPSIILPGVSARHGSRPLRSHLAGELRKEYDPLQPRDPALLSAIGLSQRGESIMIFRLSGIAAICIFALQAPMTNAWEPRPTRGSGRSQQERDRSFNDRLKETLPDFDASGQAMAPLLLGLAYKHKLPMALECVTYDTVRRPLNLRLKLHSLRDIIDGIVSAVPGFQVDFTGGLVDVYCPKARLDPSNPFNATVRRFDVTNLDTHFADAELLCSLARQTKPNTACGGSIASGQWPDVSITLHLENQRVYEILNAIVSQNGRAVWTPIFPLPRSLGENKSNFWYIYPLDPSFQSAVLQDLESAFPRPKTDEKRRD